MRDPDISYETIPGREDITGYSDTNLVTLASPKSKKKKSLVGLVESLGKDQISRRKLQRN